MDMGKPDADEKGAKGWIQNEEVAAALRAIATGNEVSEAILMAARPIGGLRRAHMHELYTLCVGMPSAAGNKGLILSRWLMAAEHNYDLDANPSLPSCASEETKQRFTRCKREVKARKGPSRVHKGPIQL